MMLFGKLAASLLCALAAALALMRAGRAERENRCKYLLLIALLTVGCSCVNWLAVDALPLSGLSQADTVTITALNEKTAPPMRPHSTSPVFLSMATPSPFTLQVRTAG